MKTLKATLFAFILFILFDTLWLGVIMKDFNKTQLAEIGRIENGEFEILLVPAFFTYVLMALAVAVFVLPRVQGLRSQVKILACGGLMGLIIYGVFDLTNLAILKNYPASFVAPDMAWGGVVFALVTWLTARWSHGRI